MSTPHPAGPDGTAYTPTLMPELRVDPRDPRQCRDIVIHLPLTNVSAAHGTLNSLLKAMRRHPPPPADYLGILELARDPLSFLQEEMTGRFSSKPLPATPEEAAIADRTVALWRLMADSYAAVAQLGGQDAHIQNNLALICERCIHYAGKIVIEYYRARRAIPRGVWLELHGYQDTAEDWGLADTVVREPLGVAGGNTTCTQTYAAVLLVDLANPYGRTARELAWIIRWAQAVAPHTQLRRPDVDAGGRGYGLDLMQDRGLLPVDQLSDTPSARLFDTSRLGEQVHFLLGRLKEGEAPVNLGLGEDCPAAQASRLLVQLYRPWCLAALPRRFERNRANGILPVAYGMENIYFHLVGADFVQPQHVRTYSRSDVESLWTFRNQTDPSAPLNLRAAQFGHALDTWDIADQSTYGFRLYRNEAGPRVEHGQLIGIKPAGKDPCLLAQISWLIQDLDGRLQAGVHVLPGPVRGIAVRPTGVGISQSEKYIRGFFVPAVPNLKEPVSVILPTGWFRQDRIIELFTDRSVSVRLIDILSRGAGFERCAFSLVE